MTIAEDVLRAKQDFDDVYEAGRKAENDAWWDAYQQNGNRTNYGNAFSGDGWTNETFKPKYNIVPTFCWYMFEKSKITGDLVEKLENLGVTLDFSNSTNNATNIFVDAKISRLGVLDFRKSTRLISTFGNANLLETIDILKVSEKLKYVGAFSDCTNLINLTIEGTIAQNGFDVSSCTNLSKASITSILNALSTTTSDLIVTFSGAAVDKAFETSPGANDGRYSQWWDEWTTYQPSDGEFRGNWTFDLA